LFIRLLYVCVLSKDKTKLNPKLKNPQEVHKIKMYIQQRVVISATH